MREQCKKCVYSSPVNVGEDCEMLNACVYILHTGKKRPCPPGKGCTVYVPRPRP